MFKKIKIILSIVFSIISMFNLISLIYYKVEQKKEEKAVEEFFVTSYSKEKKDIVKNSDNKNEYIAVLEIPSISLKRGLVNPKSKYNNVDYNIEILKNSLDQDTIFLAAHSGNEHVSFFKNLYKVNISDEVNLYRSGIKYKYTVDEIFEQKKDGSIVLANSKEKRLILTTCSKNSGKQLIVICKLLEEVE